MAGLGFIGSRYGSLKRESGVNCFRFPDSQMRCLRPAGLVVVGLHLLVILGFKRSWFVSCDVYIYNFVSERGVPVRLLFGCASDLDMMAYVVGGYEEKRSALRSALACDVVKDKWVRLPDMAMECFQCDDFFQRGRLHVFSNNFLDAQGRFVTSFEAFDPATWTWGPAQYDEFMERADCPRTCVAREGGRYYSCQGDYVAVLEKGKWVKVIDLPANLGRPKGLLEWKRSFLLFGYADFWEENLKMYLLDLETNQCTDIRVPMEYANEG